MEDTYKVRTEKFEGPLELLLHLIEKRKLHISDISLAEVTDNFLAYMNEQEQTEMSTSTNFVWIASTLLLIKSKSLLPTLELTEEEQGDIENLEQRLKLYQRFKKISPLVANLFGSKILFSKIPSRREDPVFSPYKTCTTPHLYAHITAIVKNLPKKERIPEVMVEKIMSLEEMIDQLSTRITSSLSLSFNTFAKGQGGKSGSNGREEKLNMIVGFLAMLELVKRGALTVSQEAHFADITMETEHVQTPRYT